VAVEPTLASPGEWRYRARVTLVVEGRRAGYHRARSHTLVEVDECPLAVPAVTAHLAAARDWTASLRVALRRVTVAEAPGGVVLVGAAAAAPGPADLAATESLLVRVATVRGVVLAGGGVRRTLGDPTVRVLLEPGLDLEVPADAFTQVNPAANQRLVEVVLRLGAFRAGERVLDLYCGAGNFTLPIARRHAVVDGVERDPIAVEAGRANATRAGLMTATFRAARVTEALRAFAPGTFDAVVLDPPRAGAADAVAGVAALRPPRVVYVSCDPSTLARDVRAFLARGYRLGHVQPVDLFPQTYHIETAAELLLT
jgi:23S rRNA (uracil1939-C5)-methyltransferase